MKRDVVLLVLAFSFFPHEEKKKSGIKKRNYQKGTFKETVLREDYI